MKSARFLSIISNNDVFPNPDILIKVLSKTSLSTLKRYFDYETYHPNQQGFSRGQSNKLFYCSDECCDCWLNHLNNMVDTPCSELVDVLDFNNVFGNKNIIIEMKRFIDEQYQIN